MLLWSLLAGIIIILDQLTKYLVVENIGKTQVVTLIPKVLDLVYVKNTGAAFSIFENHTWILGTISVVFCVAIVIYMLINKPKHKLSLISAGLLLGGALGNGIDRVIRHYVVDFIELTLFTFPVFNLADIAITVGALLIIVYTILYDKDIEAAEGK